MSKNTMEVVIHEIGIRRIPFFYPPKLAEGTNKKVFLRNKVPPEVKTFATHLYLNGPSYRQVRRLLENLGIEVVHSTV